MMRSFSSRGDTFVSDEPFYGAFLKETGFDHPMADEIIAAMDCDWASVAKSLSGPAPDGAPVWYQKQMVHHMVGPLAPDDLQGVTHAFLIRDPRRIVASYAQKMENIDAKGFGLAEQRRFFDREADRLGRAPPVIDTSDVLANPRRTLTALCEALGLAFDPAMLEWPTGRHPQDGVWAPHWYNRVEASTGFAPPERDGPAALSAELGRIADALGQDYAHMKVHAL